MSHLQALSTHFLFFLHLISYRGLVECEELNHAASPYVFIYMLIQLRVLPSVIPANAINAFSKMYHRRTCFTVTVRCVSQFPLCFRLT